MLSLILTVALAPVTEPPVAKIETCVWPNTCAEVAKVQPCVWPNYCAEITTPCQPPFVCSQG